MAEEPEKKAGHFTFSRNLMKATMRNSVQGDTLKKDLKSIQGQRKKLAHSWEQRKESFMKRKFSKLPVLRISRGESERERLSDESSTANNERFSRADNYKTSLDHRGGMSSQLFISSSHHENKDGLNVPLGNRKAHPMSVPKLTVKDLSRIIYPGQISQSAVLSDPKETQNQNASPITPNKLHRRFDNLNINKEPTIQSNSSSPVYSPRTQMQQGYFRTFTLHANEQDPMQEIKEMPGSPPIQIRKRASSYMMRRSEVTSESNQNGDTASRPLHQVRDNV